MWQRLDVVLAVEAGRMSIDDAAGLMDLQRRQVFRVLAGFRQHGAASLVSKKRGTPSNNRLPQAVRDIRFGKLPMNPSDGHRPLQPRCSLDDVFAWKEERTVSNNLTLQYDKVMFLLTPNGITKPRARKRVTIIDYPDERFAIRNEGRDLPYRVFDKLQKVDQAEIVENKRLGDVLAYVAERQKQMEQETRSKKAPRRQGQAERHIFKPV